MQLHRLVWFLPLWSERCQHNLDHLPSTEYYLVPYLVFWVAYLFPHPRCIHELVLVFWWTMIVVSNLHMLYANKVLSLQYVLVQFLHIFRVDYRIPGIRQFRSIFIKWASGSSRISCRGVFLSGLSFWSRWSIPSHVILLTHLQNWLCCVMHLRILS